MSLELSIISFLRDPIIRSTFINHISSEIIVEDIARTAFEAIKSADSSDLGLILVEVKKRGESREIISDIMDSFSKIDVPIIPSNLDRIVREVESYVRWRKTATQVNYMAMQDLESIVPITSKEKESYQRLSEAITFSVSFNEAKDIYNFSTIEDHERAGIDVTSSGTPLKSGFNIVNKSLQNFGYVAGELMMYVAPTGGGKSSALCSEGSVFSRNGSKVLHYVLGDLKPFDIEIKYMSNLLGKSVNKVILNRDTIWKTDPVQQMFQNVRFVYKEAGEFGIDELYNDALRWKDDFDYDALIIDYDGNIRPHAKDYGGGNGTSMYVEGGYTYSRVRHLAGKTESTALIGCQSKAGVWNSEFIGIEAASESSKKQHHVDTMITASMPDRTVPVGIMHMAKVRRGETGKRNCLCYFFNCSTILEVSKDEYDMVKEWYKKDDNAEQIYRQWGRDKKGLDIAA